MSDRRHQIVRLLETRDDNLPLPVRREHTTAGFVHNAPGRVSCPDCLANDRPMFGCETCGGRGYTEEHRARDPYAVEKVQPYGIDVTRLERERERDAEIARLQHQTAEPRSETDLIAEANQHPFAWEIARARMYASYDYQALDAQLERLREHDEGGYRALHALYVYGWAEPSTGYEAACERGLRFLEEQLPDPLRAPGVDVEKHVRGPMRPEAGKAAKGLRDSEMRDLAATGATPAAIAAEFNVSVRTVYLIVNGAAA